MVANVPANCRYVTVPLDIVGSGHFNAVYHADDTRHNSAMKGSVILHITRISIYPHGSGHEYRNNSYALPCRKVQAPNGRYRQIEDEKVKEDIGWPLSIRIIVGLPTVWIYRTPTSSRRWCAQNHMYRYHT